MATQNPWILSLAGGQNAHVIPGVLKTYSGGNNLFKFPTTQFLQTGNGIVAGKTVLPSSLVDDVTTHDYKLRLVCAIPSNGSSGKKIRWRFRYESWPYVTANQEDDPSSYAGSRQFTASIDVSTWLGKKTNLSEIDIEATPHWLLADHFLQFVLEREKDHADDNLAQDVYVHSAFLWIPY